MTNNRSNCVNLVPLLARGQVNGLPYQIPTVTSMFPRIFREFYRDTPRPDDQPNRLYLGSRFVAIRCGLEKPNHICYFRLEDVFAPSLQLFVIAPTLNKALERIDKVEFPCKNYDLIGESDDVVTDPCTEVTYIHENASLEFSGMVENLLFVIQSTALSPDHSRFSTSFSFWRQKLEHTETGDYPFANGEDPCDLYTIHDEAFNERTLNCELKTDTFIRGYCQVENMGCDMIRSYMATHQQLIKSLHCKHRARFRACTRSQPLEKGVLLSAFDIRYCEPNFYPRPIPLISLSAYSNGHIRFVNYDSRVSEAVSFECAIHDQTIRTLRHHPTNVHQFVASGDHNFLRLYDARMFAPDGSVSGGRGQLRGTQPVQLFTEHRSTHHHHQISLDSATNLLVSSGSDNLVRFWNVSSGKLEGQCAQKHKQQDHAETQPVQAFYCGDFWFDSAHRSGALLTVYQGEHRLFFSKLVEHCFNMDAMDRRQTDYSRLLKLLI